MANLKLSDAPGCIGSPLIRDENHPVCSNCAFRNVCSKLAVRNREKLIAELGLTDLSKQTGKKLMKGADKMTIAQLESPSFKGKKPLTSKGEALQGSMIKPFKTVENILVVMKCSDRSKTERALKYIKPDWAGSCLMLMWDNKGSLKKKDLREHMEHNLGYSRMVALGYVSIFINATTNMDLVKETNETLRIMND